MATKKPAAKKTATKTVKTKKTLSGKGRRVVKKLYTERNPERHTMTGKFAFFFIFFACTTLLFAAISVWLFSFSTDISGKYESIDACVHAHTSCNVRLEGEDINVEENQE